MSLPHSKALLQGLSIDPKSKAPNKHSQLKIFSLSYSYRYIYIYIYEIGTELRKFFHQDSPYYNVHGKI